MTVRIKISQLNEDSLWRDVITDQYLKIQNLNPPQRLAWFENEWNCKVDYEWDNSTRSVFFVFEEEHYLIAILKYGSPD